MMNQKEGLIVLVCEFNELIFTIYDQSIELDNVAGIEVFKRSARPKIDWEIVKEIDPSMLLYIHKHEMELKDTCQGVTKLFDPRFNVYLRSTFFPYCGTTFDTIVYFKDLIIENNICKTAQVWDDSDRIYNYCSDTEYGYAYT